MGDSGATDGSMFEQRALALFARQAVECEPYRRYLELIGIERSEVCSIDAIPFLPIELFKSQRVYCGRGEPEKIFTSSTTSGDTPSRHYVESLDCYRRSFRACYRQFYGSMPIYALLPCYLEREGSSLVFMVDDLIGSNGGGFFLNDFEALIEALAADHRQKVLLGVSYALLDLAEQRPGYFDRTVIMETGGMKGRRKELSKSDLHTTLCQAFGVDSIHSEYGMAELMSQAYSDGGGVFGCPDSMRVVVRDVNDPFTLLGCGRRGGLNIIDLNNVSSCAFVQTDDMGILYPDGRFELTGRIDHSAIRGCNLLVEGL